MGMTLHVKGRALIGYQGPLPHEGDLIELHYPKAGRDAETLTVVVTSVVHRTNGPHDSDSARVITTSIRAEPTHAR